MLRLGDQISITKPARLTVLRIPDERRSCDGALIEEIACAVV
jgi:hypothetical protein